MQICRHLTVAILLVMSLFFSAGTMLAEEGAEVGNTAPNFTLKDLDGKEISLTDFRGSVVALTFWGWGCIECREVEMPALQSRVFNLYSREQVAVLSVNMDPSPDMAQLEAYRQEKRLQFPILVNGLEAAFNLKVFATPILFLIDKDGVIRHKEANKTYDDATAAVVQELVDELEVGNQVGKRALDIELHNLDGQMVKLSDFAGKPIVVGFFGSKDGECADVVTPLQQVAKDYGDKVAVLGVTMDLDPKADELRANLAGYNLTYPILMDGLKAALYYGFSVGGAVVIDSGGMIAFRSEAPLTNDFYDAVKQVAQ